MKNLFILAFMLTGTIFAFNTGRETVVISKAETITFSGQMPSGEKINFSATGSTKNLPCCGELVVYDEGSQSRTSWVRIPIFWQSGTGSGTMTYYGPGDDMGLLYAFLMALLDAI